MFGFLRYFLIPALLWIAIPAHAGHLFTQASTNTPVTLNEGKGIKITQETFEGAGNTGLVTLDFGGDWDAGDAIKITISSYTQTFDYDAPLSGTNQGGTSLSVNDPTLTALALDLDAPLEWTVIATSGTFTLYGYRIYTGNETLNGTGAGQIDQSQVVDASDLGGGGVFEPVSDDINSGVAQVFDNLNGDSSSELGVLVTLLGTNAFTDNQREQILERAAPQTNQGLSQAASQTLTGALDTVQIRLDALRTDLPSSMNTGSSSGLSSGDSYMDRHFWVKGFGSRTDQDNKDGYAGFDGHIYGLSGGADLQLPNGWLVGGAFTYAKAMINMNDYRDGDDTDVDTYQVTAYTARSFDRWYIEGMLAYAYQDYETSRDTLILGKARGDFDGHQTAIRVLAGMPFDVSDRLTITPYAGLQVSRIHQDSYTEKGAGVLSLNVSSESVTRVRGLLGTKFGTEMQINEETVLYPSLHVGYRHEFREEGINATTSFTGGGGTFTTQGQAINRNVVTLGANLDIRRNENFDLSLQLEAEGASGYRAYSGQITGTWAF